MHQPRSRLLPVLLLLPLAVVLLVYGTTVPPDAPLQMITPGVGDVVVTFRLWQSPGRVSVNVVPELKHT